MALAAGRLLDTSARRCCRAARGGFLERAEVPSDVWGGLPLTFVLSTVGGAVAFPLAVALALGRRSDLPVIKGLCIAYIEIVRGVPLFTFLFMAAVMFPLFVPQGLTMDKLLRAQVALVMVIAAYVAEVIRGGLQAIPKGQMQAAASLGLPYWPATMFIVLPQAFRVSIPALVNTFIAFFKDTSLVIVIGLFDLLGAARAVIVDPKWVGFGVEVYLFVALVYFVFCFGFRSTASASSVCSWPTDSADHLRDGLVRDEVEPMLHVDIQGVNKWFGDLHVLRDITLGVERGERIVVCGPSGSGKSTLIRCVNRLESHQSGRIVVDGIELTSDLKAIKEVRRDVGMVFEQINLFPHLTILENCTLAPIWAKGIAKREATDVAAHYLRRVRIPEQAHNTGSAVGRPAAARGHCAVALHETEDHAVRRADVCARPGNGQRSARHRGVPRGRGHDDDLRHTRDGIRPAGGEPDGLHGRRPNRRGERARRVLRPSPPARASLPQPDSSLTAGAVGLPCVNLLVEELATAIRTPAPSAGPRPARAS